MPPLPNNGANSIPPVTPGPIGDAQGGVTPAWATLDTDHRVEAIFTNGNLSPRQAAQQIQQLKQQVSGSPSGTGDTR